MTPLVVWFRRSTAVLLAPVILGALIFESFSTDGWQYEWLWGLRNVVGIVPLVAPLVAGGVAFDVSQRWGPTITDLGPSTPRWKLASVAPVVTGVLWAFLCVMLAWAVAAVRLQSNDAIGAPDLWLPLETLAALLAAGMVGFALGRRIQSVAAAPIAAVVVFAASALAAPFGLNNLFSPLGLSSSAVGLTRDSNAALLHIGMNLAVAALCCVFGLRGVRRTRAWSASLAALTAALAVIAIVPATEFDFRPLPGPEVCVRQGSVTACGPQSARPLVSELGQALQQAMGAVGGLQLPREYLLIAPGAPLPSDRQRTVVMASPAGLRGDERARTLAEILSFPSLCLVFFEGGVDLEPLLNRQEAVRGWIERALRSGGLTAPAEIQAAYADLQACKPSP